jgi:hypothetical protein
MTAAVGEGLSTSPRGADGAENVRQIQAAPRSLLNIQITLRT